MRKALRDLKRFILAKNTDDERHEIRSYVLETADELGSAFGVTADAIAKGTDVVGDDAKLARRLLEEIARAESSLRCRRVEDRSIIAQGSADMLGGAAQWRDGVAILDIVSLMASALTRRADMLVFACEAFTVAVFMAPLFDLARLKKSGMTAFVDARGLHIRWETGGLNLRHRTEPGAGRIVVNLPARAAAAA